MTEIHSICKQCKEPMTFNVDDELSKQLYCTDVCHQAHWLKNGIGLVHPTCPENVLNFPKTYGNIKMCRQVLKIIAH